MTDCLAAVGVKSVAVIAPLAGVTEGWDAADALEDGWTPEHGAELVANAVPATKTPDSSESQPISEEANEEIRRLAFVRIPIRT